MLCLRYFSADRLRDTIKPILEGAMGTSPRVVLVSFSFVAFSICDGSAGTRRHRVRLGGIPVQNKCGNSSLNRFNMLDAGPSRVCLDEPINSILQEKLRATFEPHFPLAAIDSDRD